MLTRLLMASAIVLAGGCKREPAAPTTEESRQLDEAANLLNEAPANLDSVDDLGLDEGNSAEPERP